MNRIGIFILIIFLISCKGKIHSSIEKVDKLYFITYIDEITDTVKIFGILQPDNEFKPIDSINYWINNKPITIIKLSNEPAPTDGGMIAYWEKNVGIFYQSSTTWHQYFRLKSSNDSVNDFINSLYGLILMQYNYDENTTKESNIIFTQPSVIDTIVE
jgi:hypothetical protein